MLNYYSTPVIAETIEIILLPNDPAGKAVEYPLL
jgi:hypothetical protein